MPINEVDLAWLENIELPPLTWTQARKYHEVQGDQAREPNPLFDAIDAIRHRYGEIDRLDWACGDTTIPVEERERIARAFFRVAAWESLASNELNEGQKAWAITQLKKKSQEAERFLAIWMASADPHAMLVRALRNARPEAAAIEIGRIVERVCGGWEFAANDVSKASMRTLRKHFAELARAEWIVEAVHRWLTVIPDFERRVLHAGPVLATDGSVKSATALHSVLAEAEMRGRDTGPTWVTRIWSKLVPDGSAVAGLLDVHP